MGGVGEKIMVGALTGVMSPLLGKLTNLIGEEYTKLKGVRKKLESLTKELIAINVMLEKYAAMEKPDRQVKAWMKEVRELAYDIEDRIDLFTYHVDHEPADKNTGFKGLLQKNIRKLKKLHHRHKFAEQIQELQALANEVYERKIRNKLDETTSSTTHTEIDPRLPALYVEVEKLVGIEGPSEKIITPFIGEETTKQLKLVSIVGPGGSGKTTLAKQVYDKIKGQFYYTAFVSVSQKPNINSILSVLLTEIESISGSSEPMRSYSNQQLIDRLRSYLGKERYLIVIDDIWEKSAWKIIQCALPKNDHASRIITTTRINNVAESCCTSNEDFVYRMIPLSSSDAKKLFVKRTFDGEDKCPGQLEEIMNEILHKCDGLPLAIVTLASLLANKPRIKEEWKRVLNSIRSIDEKDKELQIMDKILALSYSDLPHNLKTTLLYLSIFPEDYMIERDCLVWRWIAEGFIASKPDYTLEEVGRSYFNELINRSLIQPIDMEYNGKARACRVHDLVLDFIVSRSIEENFVSMLDCQDVSSQHGKIRRLTISGSMNEHAAAAISQGTTDLSHLRSISLFDVGWMPPPLDLQVLRVLDLWGCLSLENDDLGNIIGRLFHLRYLGLQETNIDKLPVQIGKLELLQTLDLRRSRITELPEAIVQLKRLMRFVGNLLILPEGFGNMEALEELWELDGNNSALNFGQKLRELRVLRVYFDCLQSTDSKIKMNTLISSLCSLGERSLRCVYIRNETENGDIDCFADSWCPPPRCLQKFVLEGDKGWFSRSPKWINPSLSELTYLQFSVERMEREDLHMLEELPALLVLDLTVQQIPEDGLRMSHSGFPCLTHLDFFNICGAGLRFEGGATPKLEKLNLGFDADKAHFAYGSFGFGIRHLRSLKLCFLSSRTKCEQKDVPEMKAAVMSDINNEVKLLPNHTEVEIKIVRDM